MPKVHLAALLLAVGPGAAVAAQGDDAQVWQRMADDAVITVQEVRANSTRAFRAIDADGNRIVTRTEFMAYPLPERLGGYANRRSLRSDLFERIDLDSDGMVAAPEWEEAVREDVSVADGNDDGTVTLHELATVDLGSVIADFFH